MTDGVAELTDRDRAWLLGLARRALEHLPERLTAAEVDDVPPGCREARGAFVTLHNHGQLRGCIGYVVAAQPLFETVLENVYNAARRDPRFPPVETGEVADLHIEISVMTPPRPITDIEEIEVGTHGLIVGRGAARGLLLPQVATEYGWDCEEFLGHTCLKAGLPAEAWRGGDLRIEVFSADVFGEPKK